MAKKLKSESDGLTFSDGQPEDKIKSIKDEYLSPAPTGKSDHEKNVAEVCRILESTDRQGTERDKPEGTRWIVLSDTLARKIVTLLQA